MMGAGFVATAIGNKLTQIGAMGRLASFDLWLTLSGAALFMAIVLLFCLSLSRSCRRCIPGMAFNETAARCYRVIDFTTRTPVVLFAPRTIADTARGPASEG